MTLLFSLLPSYASVIYILITLYFFEDLNVFIVLITLPFLAEYTKSFHLSTKISVITLILFYFLPDVSHYITNEKTVLNINNITVFDLIDNFFFLLPHSVLALIR